MSRLTDTSFVIFSSYIDTSYFGGPLYAYNGRAYGVSGKLLWRRNFGIDGHQDIMSGWSANRQGGVEFFRYGKDSTDPFETRFLYYDVDENGRDRQPPVDLTSWPPGIAPAGVEVRANRLGFLAFKTGFVSGLPKMFIYRADRSLGSLRTDMIDYGLDTLHEFAQIYPTSDDGFLYLASGPPPSPRRTDRNRYTYLARYDAQGRKLWGGKQDRLAVTFDVLADGGLLVKSDLAIAFNGANIATAFESAFSRLGADSSIVWRRASFTYGDTLHPSTVAFDGRDGGILFGETRLRQSGDTWPWVAYVSNLGRPLDPTPTRPVFAGPATALRVYPNPAKAGGMLRYKLPEGQGKAALKLIGMDGRQILTSEAHRAEGDIHLPDALPAGLYVLRCGGGQCRLVVE